MPLNYRKALSFGYTDGSVRLKAVDGADRSLAVFENLHDDVIRCVSLSSDGHQVVMGGDDCAVSVWHFRKSGSGDRRLELRGRLCGHSTPVCCVVLSQEFSIIVSGSVDGMCIVWDLNRLEYVRELSDPACRTVSCLVVNDATGDIVVCSLAFVFVYSVNGDSLARRQTSSLSTEEISSVSLSHGTDWSHDDVIVTGHTDGSVRFWGWECGRSSASSGSSSPRSDLILLHQKKE